MCGFKLLSQLVVWLVHFVTCRNSAHGHTTTKRVLRFVMQNQALPAHCLIGAGGVDFSAHLGGLAASDKYLLELCTPQRLQTRAHLSCSCTSPSVTAEEDLVDMAASQGWRCLAFVLLLLCDPARLSRVSVRTQRKGIFAEAMRRLQEVFDIEALPHDVLPHRKPPQFMVDLFNKVADSNGITKAPGLLEGNVVRSLEDRGKPQRGRWGRGWISGTRQS